MEDIKVTSLIDLKTYFNISLLSYFKLRMIVIMLIATVFVSFSIMSDPSAKWWEELLLIFVMLVFFCGLVPLRMYFACKKNMKKVAYLSEVQSYSINAEKIEYKGKSTSSSSNWQYVTKLVEREKYFLLMTSNRSFHYLPKAGFESTAETDRFKNLVQEKGIKMTYH
jgi:hypothetical protein